MNHFSYSCGFFFDISRELLRCDADEMAVLSWMCCHPQAYRSTVLACGTETSPPRKSERMLTGLPYEWRPSGSVVFRIETEKSGVCCNSLSAPMERLPWVVHRISLAHSLWNGNIHVMLVSLNAKTTTDLIAILQSHKELIHIKGEHKLERCGVFLRAVKSLHLLGSESPSGHASCVLDQLKHLPHLERIFAAGQYISGLGGLDKLTHLQEVDVSSTLISDYDISLLAGLTNLRVLWVNDCVNVTDLDRLERGVARLETLYAAGCRNLLRVGRLGFIPTLKTIDLSHSAGHCIKALLESPLGATSVTLNYAQFPCHSPTSQVGCTMMPYAEYISLVGATISHIEWLCCAPSIQYIVLNRTSITDRQVSQLAQCCETIREIFLCQCPLLRSSLEWGLRMPVLTALFISESSVVESRASRTLKANDVLFAR